jgi:hypothetical protein
MVEQSGTLEQDADALPVAERATAQALTCGLDQRVVLEGSTARSTRPDQRSIRS